MKIVKILIICMILVLVAITVSSYSLPDLKPILIFNFTSQETVAVLTAVATDSLTNAGILSIEIYEDNQKIAEKECKGMKTCTLTKTIVKSEPITKSYYAKAIDLGGNTVQSEIITIKFKGIFESINIPPIINSSRLLISPIGGSFYWEFDPSLETYAYTYYEQEKIIELVKGRAIGGYLDSIINIDNDILTYKWFVNGEEISNERNFNYNFTKEGQYNITYEVFDGKEKAIGGWFFSIVKPNIQGIVTDIDIGTPLDGLNISIYPSSLFNAETNDTNAAATYDLLQPKFIPDAVTDKNGNYSLNLPDGVYHIVVQGSKEIDFAIYVNSSKEATKHNIEVSKKVDSTIFNAEGHIVHSGKYADSNNYTVGNIVYFTMFGVNNGGTNETITFAVQDHTSIGGPNAPIVYYGSIDNPNESLTIPAGQKLNKMFKFRIPANYSAGRYDIHVLWNNETWHKIGNFFVVPDTTAPYVFGWDSLTTYTNSSTRIPYDGENVPQPGTIGYNEIQFYYMMEGFNEPKWGVKVCADKDIATDEDNDGIADNDEDTCMINPPRFVGSEDIPRVNYTKSGHYIAKITATDDAGNTNSTYTNITVYAIEEEVDAIATAIYGMFVPGWLPLHKNRTLPMTWFSPVSYGAPDAWDRTTIDDSCGDEYMTPWDGLNGTNGINWAQIGALEYRIVDRVFPSAKAIFPMTGEEYNYTLSSFLLTLNCVYNNYGPDVSCNYRQFAPEIYTCTPNSVSSPYYSIMPCYPQSKSINITASQVYTIAVRDPNNDPYKIHWYVNGIEILNTEDHNQHYMSGGKNETLVFIANSTLIGNHKIKAAAWDESGMNISIVNGPNNIYEWNLTITA
ncbi:MAG: hypothetical protein QW041_02115 [Candidatus Pacearchaeota archaeon]